MVSFFRRINEATAGGELKAMPRKKAYVFNISNTVYRDGEYEENTLPDGKVTFLSKSSFSYIVASSKCTEGYVYSKEYNIVSFGRPPMGDGERGGVFGEEACHAKEGMSK